MGLRTDCEPQISESKFMRVLTSFAFSGLDNMAIYTTGGKTWFLRFQRSVIDVSTRYADLESFLREDWESGFLTGWDANDLLVLLKTWQDGDCSLVHHGGNYEKCLKEMKAKGLVMPSKTDLYFPVSIRKSSGTLIIDMIFNSGAWGQPNWSFSPSKC